MDASTGTNRTVLRDPGVTVVVPALNEEGAVEATVEALTSALARLDLPSEILLVDDGSTDGTAALARRAGARVLSHPMPGGYGHALKTGIRAARHETIVIVDCDGTYPIEEIPRLVGLSSSYDMVVGARTGPHFRRQAMLSPMRSSFVWLSSFVVGRRIPDPNSGLRVFRRSEVMPLLDRLPRAFSFTTTLTLVMMLAGRFVHFEPIAYGARIGRSKVRLFRDALRVGQTLVEVILTHNPLKLFLLLSLLPLLLGLVAALAWPDRLGLSVAFVMFAAACLVFALGMGSVVVLFRRPRPPDDD